MFRVEIETSNAAFSDGESEFAGPELARILRALADRVEGGIPTGDGASLRDVNGNTVGAWAYQSDEE